MATKGVVDDRWWRELGAPGWVGVSDGKYSELIQRKAVAVIGETRGVMANTASKRR